MGWKFCSAAGCSVDCIRKPIVLRSFLITFGVYKSNKQDHRKMLKRDIFMSSMAGLLGHAFPAGDDPSPASDGGQPSETQRPEEPGNTEPISNITQPRQVRRRQHQELPWGTLPLAEGTQSTGNSLPSVPTPITRRHAQPSCRQQQQELLWGAPPSHDSPLLPQPPPQQLDPCREGVDGEAFQQDEHVGSLDLLAQHNEAMLTRSGRHRNRMAVSPVQEQPPDVITVVHCAGPQVDTVQDSMGQGHDGNDSNGDVMPVSVQRQDIEGSQLLHPHRGQTSEQQVPSAMSSMMRPQPPNSNSALESNVDGSDNQGVATRDSAVGDAGNSGFRGVVLRFRRYGSDTSARRRIRLPLQQRPKPWPVNVLLGAQHQEQQEQGQKPYEGQAKERDQQGLNLEDITAGLAVAVGHPPGLLQEGEGEAQRGQRAGGGRRGLEDVQARDVSLVDQELRQLQMPAILVDEQLQRGEGKRDAEVQVPYVPREQPILQFQLNHEQGQKSEHEQTQQQQQLRQKPLKQQDDDQEQKLKVRKPLAEKNLSQANVRNSKLCRTGRLQGQAPYRIVAAHPDGTLWSYRAKDVEPLATRVLQQLLKRPVESDPREGSLRPQDSEFTLGNLGPEANGGASGKAIDASDGITAAADNVDPESISSGVCHILAAGSHQSYNLVRALSYVQGVLRVAAYNGHIKWVSSATRSSSTVTASGPSLGIIATGVSLSKLRMYYEQTVLYSSTPKPELGPSPPPLPPPPRAFVEGGDLLTSGKDVVTCPQTPHAFKDTAAGPEVALPAGTQQLRLDRVGALGPAVRETVSTRRGTTHVSGQPLPSTLLKGWPKDAAQIYPRALVSAFLVQPPLDWMHGGTAVSAPLGGDLPPVAVSASADVHALARLLVARLHICGYCRIQALGQIAVSHTLRILSIAGWILSRAGLGVLAFPHMGPRGAEPRAELPLSPKQVAGRLPTAAAAVPSMIVAAVEAGLDPVLLDKAPQLVLEVVPCGWDEHGRPVVSERLGPLVVPTAEAPGSAAAAAVATMGTGALSSAEVLDDNESRHVTGSNPRPEQPVKEFVRHTVQSGTDSGKAKGSVFGSRASPIRLMAQIAEATTSVELSLGGPNGGPDTRTTTAAVARGMAEGRRVVLTARGLGSLLRLPVVVFRAQGALAELVRPQRRALMFTLRNAGVDLNKLSGGESLRASSSETLEWARRQIQSLHLRRSRVQQQEQQQGQQHYASEVLQFIQPTATGLRAETEAKVVRWAEGDSLAAEVFQVQVSALQHHLDSLPRFPSEGIIASSVHRRFAASNGQGRGEDTGGVEDGDSGPNQQYVEAAAAAATEHLLQYGMAVLVGTSPGSRLTALLAAACVSEGLMCSAGLTVLVRVDPRVMPQAVKHIQTLAQQQHFKAKPVSTLRPLPPKRYQLLLSRFNPRVGRLQLLRPDELAIARFGMADG